MNSALTLDEKDHKYFLNGNPIPGVNEILTSVGLQDHWGSEIDMLRGTYIHQACQYWDEGALDEADLDPYIAAYLAGWKKFVIEKNFKPILIEKMLHSRLGFAGRIDRYGLLDGIPTIIDIKSGDPGWITGLKLAGYEQLLREHLESDESNKNIFIHIKRVAIRLSADAKWKPYFYIDRNDKEIFLSAVSIVNFKIRKDKIWKQT